MCEEKERPYIVTEKIVVTRKYNPNYGDHRVCNCGHTYYRHFDTYDEMRDVGCKYCSCYTFEEDPESNGCIALSGEVSHD
jgi:hypothetical protein